MKNVIIFLIILCSQLLFAQEEAGNLLEELQNKFDTIETLQVSISQNNGTHSGTYYFKYEKSARLEMKPHTIVTDGVTTWSYNESTNKLVINDFDDSEPSVLTLNKFVFDYPAECELSIEDGTTNVLHCKPKNPYALNFNEVVFTVTEDYVIKQLKITDLNGETVSFSLGNYKINKDINDAKFSFSPDESMKVVDLRF